MIGKIIDMTATEAFVILSDGSTMDVGISHVPRASKIGDNINLDMCSTNFINERLPEMF